MYPDPGLSELQTKEEQVKLEEIKSGLSAEEKEQIILGAQALQERQQQDEDLDVLPKVGLPDVPDALKIPGGQFHPQKRITTYKAPTNGIVYQQIITEIPELPQDLLNLMPLYSRILTEVGSGNRDYLETQLLQHADTGGLSAFSSIRACIGDAEKFDAFFTLGSRTLRSKSTCMLEILKETSESARFDELDRIRDLVKQVRVRREVNIAGNGHTYAMTAASSRLRPVPWLNHQLTGLQAIEDLKQLDDSLDDNKNLEVFCSNLAQLRDILFKSSRQFLLVGEGHEINQLMMDLGSVWSGEKNAVTSSPLSVEFTAQPGNQAYITSTPVNYCASVFPTVPEEHEDSAALTVLANVLRNGFLHPAIREQGGAYGGGATHDTSNGLFRFYSYRDPRLQETFTAFQQSVGWMLTDKIGFPLVEEAILGIVSSIDAPGSPAGEARQAFHSNLHGRGVEERKQLRSRILGVNEHDIKRVAERYLQSDGLQAIVTSESRRDELDDSFEIVVI
jgi:Zn-dependent M16 (insulinase) family peptidase